MLTEDDDLIRARDIPERMQLATSSLSESSTLFLHAPLTADDLNGAAMWIIQRLPSRKTALFFAEGGQYFHLSGHLVLAVTFVLRELFVVQNEVPYVWVHKRDYISYFDINDPKNRLELLNSSDLWIILQLGYKYRSLLERRQTLATFYERLQAQDDYFETDILPKIDGVEEVADATDWLMMKYKDKKQDNSLEFQFHDDEEPQLDAKKHKTPSRISAYEVAKKSVVAKLAKGFGIEAHQVVQNFMTASHLHDIEDPELNPLAFAEQFADPDPTKALPAEELLNRARLILATELGKDPLLRSAIRKRFKDDAMISVEPTERGMSKIDDHHPYYVRLLFLTPVASIDSLAELQISIQEAYQEYPGVVAVSSYLGCRGRASCHHLRFPSSPVSRQSGEAVDRCYLFRQLQRFCEGLEC
jgi:transcription elongation factor SPT6